MQAEFIKYIKEKKLWKSNQKLLLAISGGADSVALFYLLLDSGYHFTAAHCNFKLRGKESEGDEKFVQALCKKYKIKLHCACFDTTKYAKENKLSIQMAARELRYNYFNKLLHENNYEIILTAHHANDLVETFFINLLRGSGLKGLAGIPAKRGKVVRPLLPFGRNEIENYLKNSKIAYKEDSSNRDDKYLRNNLRLHIIPSLVKLNPSFSKTLQKEIDLLQSYENLMNNYFNSLIRKEVKREGRFQKLKIKWLRQFPEPQLFLFHWLNEYGFHSNTYEKIPGSLSGVSGKQFHSETHSLITNREYLILQKKPEGVENDILIQKDLACDFESLKLKRTRNFKVEKKPHVAYINEEKLIFPLKIRSWKTGDRFKPLGMNNYKKLSDFFIGIKMSRFEKENVRILENGNGEIIWVINFRLDERYKVPVNGKDILKAKWDEGK